MLDSLDLKMLSSATTSQKEETSNTDYEVVMFAEQTGGIRCKIELRRKFMRCFIENIAPSGLLVVISWVMV